MLVTGPEALLAERAVENVVADARSRSAGTEVSDLDARTYAAGTLPVLVSPSLFGEQRLIVVRHLHEGNDEVVHDISHYLRSPTDDVVLVLVHAGGPKARKLVDEARSAAGVIVECSAVKSDTDRLAFVAGEFAAQGRRVVNRAAQALVDAFGSDLRELASACAQLASDTEGDVDEAQVSRYYGGRAESTGFEVADAVVARRRNDALLQLRRALDCGVEPIPLVAVMAMKLRTMAKVASARGRGADVAKELGMPPWMVDRARRDLTGWTPTELSDALVRLAAADTALKGGTLRGGVPRGRSVDGVYVLERLVLGMTS